MTPEEAAAYPYSPAQRASIESMRRKAFVGTAEQVAARLSELAQSLGLDELAGSGSCGLGLRLVGRYGT